jgi:peptidoglycan hydrolase-like protein with peptidoglycan-binding domain
MSSNIRAGQEGAAVRDVQSRLALLGFDLGKEVDEGIFGPLTARAVSEFRLRVGLAGKQVVDADAWAALVDETFVFGDRVLYLRMPHFHGRDVNTLQIALVSLGFSCTPDGIFGVHTERAVREFQMNVGFRGDGIVGDASYAAINRLRHAWEGRDMIALGDRPLGFARAAAVLENTPICIFGTDATGRAIADRISNLAAATTPASRVVSAPSLDQVPSSATLMVQLAAAGDHSARENEASSGRDDPRATPQADDPRATPQVVYDSDITINTRLRTALEMCVPGKLEMCVPGKARITVRLAIAPDDGKAFSPREEQHAAIILLDALCEAFG